MSELDYRIFPTPSRPLKDH